MRQLTCFASLIWFAGVITSVAATPGNVGHSIEAVVDGESSSIVAVSGATAKIQRNGKLVKVSDKAPLRIQNNQPLSSGFVELQEVEFASVSVTTVSEDGFQIGGAADGGTDVQGYVVAKEPHEDCYVAAIFLRDGFLGGPPQLLGVLFGSVGHLDAKRKKHFDIDAGYRISRYGRESVRCCLMVFADGHEIATNNSDAVAALFARPRPVKPQLPDLPQTSLFSGKAGDEGLPVPHAEIVRQYVEENPGADKPLRPYRADPLLLSPGNALYASAPEKVDVLIKIDAGGEVVDVTPQQTVDPKISDLLKTSLARWRFFPRLKKGMPAAGKLQTTIVLKANQPVPGAPPQ